MNEKNITVKEKNGSMLLQGTAFLVLAVISLIIALMPYLSADAKNIAAVFYIAGGISFAIFLTLFIYLLYKECKPSDALIITSRGFTDTKNVGADITIEWTNVSSVKLLGKKDMPFLGITLENSDIVIAKMKKKEADEMRENIEENLPHILISQRDVRASVKELKDIFVKFVREARILNSETVKRTKNNPFSTDDVLRAFGKLPTAAKTDNDNKVDDESIIETKNVRQDTGKASDADTINSAEPPEKQESSETVNADAYNDPFYALLQKQARDEDSIETNNVPQAEKKTEEVKVQETTTTVDEAELVLNDDEMPDEMKELMSRAKSSKISELGKILNEKDTPTAHLRPLKDAKENVLNDDDCVHIDLTSVLFEEEKAHEEQQIEFDFSETKNEAENEEIAVPEIEEKQPKHDDKTDTKEYFPDLAVISDSFKNGDSDIDSDDDSDFIIPEPIEYDEDE